MNADNGRRGTPPVERGGGRSRVVTVEELTGRNVELVAQLEQAAKAKRTVVDRIVDVITAFCGSIAFVWLHLLWFGGWILPNLMPGIHHWDPFPFGLLTMVVSLEAILLSTFILITQNRQAQLAERRNHLDLQINLLSEQENTKMLTLLHAIARKLEVEGCDDREITLLKRDVPVARVAKQIERTIEAESEGGKQSPDF
jgi:uncharacterized membrane protein